MARTPADATRFTATGPYASSSSSFTSNPTTSPGSQISFNTPAPPENETPQQKIARLRAAAQAAKTTQTAESGLDRTIRLGRQFADRAHRFTTIGLISATALTAVVAGFGIGDMILHNRRRRKEWLARKRAEEAREVAEARGAMEGGTATGEQVLLVNRERARREAEEEKKARPGMLRRGWGWVTGGLSKEETKGGRLGQGREKEVMREDSGVLQSVEARRREGERVEEVLRPVGGPLDREAERGVNAAAEAGKSWMSWVTGK